MNFNNDQLAISILSLVILSQLVYSVFSYEIQNSCIGILFCHNKLSRIILTSTYVFLLNFWFEISSNHFYVSIVFLACLFAPYLIKSSRYRLISNGTKYRKWHDKLIITSLVYTMASVYALYKFQFEFAFLCAVTSVGSILYHYNRESRFFNMDNIFATSLLVVFLYTLFLSYYQNEVYFLIGCPGIFTAVFLLRYCGDPALIEFDKLNCCYRSELSIYNTYHTLWHISSGVGPFMSIYFIETVSGDSYLNSSNKLYLYSFALLCGFVLNIIGNLYEVIPFD